MKFRNIGISLFVISAMMLSGACGNQSAGKESGSAAESSTTAVQSDASETEEISENDQNAGQDSDGEYALALDTTIEETTLFDDGTVCVKAKELTFQYNTPVLNIEITNQSDKNLQFLAGTLGYSCNSVNGMMVHSGYLNAKVAPGKTAVEQVHYDADELKLYGIKEIAEMKMAIQIEDDDYQEYAQTEPVSIQTSAYDKWDQTQKPYWTALHSAAVKSAYGYDVIWESQEALFDAENVKILSSALVKNKDDEMSLLLEVENTSDKIVNAIFSDIEVNGLVLSSGNWTGDTLDLNTRCISVLNINRIAEHGAGSLDVLENGKVANVGFGLEIEDTNNNTLKTEEVSVDITGEDKTSHFSGEEVYNDHDITILMMGASDVDATYYYIPFVVSNGTETIINTDVDYGSLSLNDVMTDSLNYSLTLKPGKTGVMNVQISKKDAEAAGISALSDIKNMELTFEIRDNQTYDDIDTPTVKITL